MNIIIRPIKENEIPLLTDFLYEAIFLSDTDQIPPRTIIQEPSLWRYINNFGKEKDDYCFIAQVDNYIVGAVWIRCIQGFGIIGGGYHCACGCLSLHNGFFDSYS